MKAHFSIRAIALASAAWSGALALPALAQDAAVPSVEEEGAIVVTARRREETLVSVPIAVSAFSGEALERGGAIDITDLANMTPNTTLEASRGTNSTLTAFIRGVGQQDPVSGFEQGVGIYLDDVYLNRPQGAILDIYDVERIEVLRGPQGTLYGRNTIGGAVKYVTKMLPQEFSLKLKGTYGSYDQADGIISVSAPLSDMIRVGGAFARLSRGGFGDNLTTGDENYNKDIWAGRATFEMGGYGQPVLMRITGDYTKDNSSARGGHRLIPGQLSGAPVLGDVFDTRGGLTDPKQYVKSYGLSMNITAELSEAVTLRSISAWRKDDSASPIDFDALPAVDVDVPAFYFNEQLSQEFQLLYDQGPLHGMVGFYYLDAKADTAFDVRLFTTVAGLTAYTQADVDTETYAVFGDFTFDITEQLSLSAGGRYTWDKRRADVLRQNYLGGGSPLFGGAGVAFGAPSTNFNGEREYKKFTPRVSISYKPTPDHNIYASFSQGFKGGGFDPRGVGTNAPDLNGDGIRQDDEIASFLSFAPEQVDSYEVGYKGNFLDGALYVAVAGFYADYKDVQIPGSVACTVSVGGVATPSFCGVVSNAGKARFKGLEFESTARLGRDLMTPGDRLNLSTAVGYIDAEYREYIANVPNPLNPTQNVPTNVAALREVQNTPKWTASGTMSYTTPIGAGSLYLASSVSWRSKTYQFEIPNPYIDQKGYALWDASIVYTAPDDRWTLGLHGKNLMDKEYKTSGYTFVGANNAAGFPTPTLGREGTLTAFYGNPRQVFLTGTVKF
ncbi:TonB-dependent receptor [Sphingobium sp. RAC03]|uniref:TonB-dependent receptor n=1 Tax=Sphingobium sp. RAC03 TaxID=1843368 RepID=UPI00083D7D28|nr:TonB-dependent receptor [Sphingobium sp. RAC03]AOF97307.1 tonB dependent receptor family protein [Sphingobium sp. RAC03]